MAEDKNLVPITINKMVLYDFLFGYFIQNTTFDEDEIKRRIEYLIKEMLIE